MKPLPWVTPNETTLISSLSLEHIVPSPLGLLAKIKCGNILFPYWFLILRRIQNILLGTLVIWDFYLYHQFHHQHLSPGPSLFLLSLRWNSHNDHSLGMYPFDADYPVFRHPSTPGGRYYYFVVFCPVFFLCMWDVGTCLSAPASFFPSLQIWFD